MIKERTVKNAGSMIFEIKFWVCDFLLLASAGAITLRGPILISFLTLWGQITTFNMIKLKIFYIIPQYYLRR